MCIFVCFVTRARTHFSFSLSFSLTLSLPLFHVEDKFRRRVKFRKNQLDDDSLFDYFARGTTMTKSIVVNRASFFTYYNLRIVVCRSRATHRSVSLGRCASITVPPQTAATAVSEIARFVSFARLRRILCSISFGLARLGSVTFGYIRTYSSNDVSFALLRRCVVVATSLLRCTVYACALGKV